LVSASSASSSCSLRTLACSSFTSKILLLSKEPLGSTTLEHHMSLPLLGLRSIQFRGYPICPAHFNQQQPVAPWPCHHTPGTVTCTSADTIACSLSHAQHTQPNSL
jgi:hypothetical protein